MGKAEQGISYDRYMIIPRVLIFIRDGERVLLLKGAPTKRLWANKYNGVGGHVEKGEDVLSAARRELLEETGLVVPNLRLVGTMIVDAGTPVGVGILVFVGDYAGGELTASSEGTLEWVEIGQLNNLPLMEDLKVMLNRIVKMVNGDVPFAARSFYDENDRQQVIYS
jgi:8-oxo-dGTP diphosphatase